MGVKAELVLSTPTKQCKRLGTCLRKSIAFHHAGLHSKQRELIEDNFRSGVVTIIVATPTLAMGVDLPAFRTVIRDLKRYGRLGMADIPVLEYAQMCVPGDTKITVKTGEKKISEINIDDFVLTYDETTSKKSYNKVKKIHRRSVNNLITLTTIDGFSLRLTSNHPVYCFAKGKYVWKPAGTIQSGDFVFVNLYLFKGNSKIPFVDFIPKSDVYVPNAGEWIVKAKERNNLSDSALGEILDIKKNNVYAYKYNKKALAINKVIKLHNLIGNGNSKNLKISRIKSKYGNTISFPEFLKEDFLWLVGIIASDGTLTSTIDKRTGSRYVKIRISNKNRKIIDKAVRVLAEYVEGKAYLAYKEGVYSLEKGCTLLADVLKDHFGIPHGKKSFIIRAPKFLYSAAPELIGAYLAGVFDGDGSYSKNKRVHFSTASKRFSRDVQLLMNRLGVSSIIKREKAGQTNYLKGKNVKFSKLVYGVKITNKWNMKNLAIYMKPLKTNFNLSYSKYNNINNFHDSEFKHSFHRIEKSDRKFKNTEVYNLTVETNSNYFANNILVHNCGRAGRPGKEDYGEAICIAQTESEADAITEHYLKGDPEQIDSKLAVEPVLRTYVLSLIASNFVRDMDSLYDFFSRTFYAYQYGDLAKLNQFLRKTVKQLRDWEFLKDSTSDFVSADTIGDESLEATLLGKRVAELYLDPYTGKQLLDGLRRATAISTKPFSWLHLVANTIEMRPLLNVRVAEYEDVVAKEVEYENNFLALAPSQFEYGYEEFLESIKTASFLFDWCEEYTEEQMLELYNVRPGEVHAKLERGDWLFYSLEELAKLPDLRKTLEKTGEGSIHDAIQIKEWSARRTSAFVEAERCWKSPREKNVLQWNKINCRREAC
ncbi:MAG: LAGLIDADG family homing endonuclease [Candidatus Woesearchaeota archaeon]